MSTLETNSIIPMLSQEVSHLISKIAEKEMDFFTDDGIEVLHDFRVDIRKLRTWLQIFEMAGYPVKKLQKHSLRCHLIGDELRNFDVLLHWMKKNLSLVSKECLNTVNLKRKKLKKAFIKELITENAISKLRILGRDFLSHNILMTKSDFQPSIEQYIHKKKQKFHQILPHVADDLEQLHKIRKILKKIRYSLYLMPIIDVDKIDTMKELQDILGYINDRRVWIEILHSKLRKVEGTSMLETIFREEINGKIGEFRDYIANEKGEWWTLALSTKPYFARLE